MPFTRVAAISPHCMAMLAIHFGPLESEEQEKTLWDSRKDC